MRQSETLKHILSIYLPYVWWSLLPNAVFFCDEATALVAGHRPCGQCRPLDYRRYMNAWQQAYGLEAPPRAGEIDSTLHSARMTQDKTQIRTSGRLVDLPDGAIVSFPEESEAAWLIWQGSLHRWFHEGYGDRRPIVADEEVIVLTPEPTIRVLAAGYQPVLHSSVAG